MISLKIEECLDRFAEILSAGHLERCEAEVPSSVWQDELGRFRVWVANTDANKTGELSLDYRLLDASHIGDQVIRQLGRLYRALDDLEMTVSEAPLESISDSEPEESGDGGSLASGIPLIYQNLVHSINSLHQMSLLIRNPATCDRFVAPMQEDDHLEIYDRRRVSKKYPHADPAIVNRLGSMVSSRRSILRYREKRHKKLSHGLLSDHLDTDTSGPYGTTVTDPSPQDNIAFTEYSLIVQFFSLDEEIMLPPPRRESAKRRPFRCPYYFCIIKIKDEIRWVEHIFRDLMPYVCIFPDCDTRDKLYASRDDWFNHLIQKHSFTTGADPNRPCPLCQEPLGDDYATHLAGHLMSVSLLALPQEQRESIKGRDVEKEQPSQHIGPSTDHKGKSADIAMKHPEEKIQSGTTEAQYQDPITRFSKASYRGGLFYICCQCNDGPKQYNLQPICILCQHRACKYCTKA